MRVMELIVRAMQEIEYFTDLKLIAGRPCAVRVPRGYRALDPVPLTAADIRAFLDEFLPAPSVDERLAAGAGQFEFTLLVPGRARLRTDVCLIETGETLAVSLRKLPIEPPNFEECALPVYLKKLLTRRGGLILVCGATGSGKTTSEAAMLRYLNEEFASHIVTIEKPIEYVFTDRKSIVTQLQIPDVAPSFKVALERVLRQDPDVIMIGEALNLDTMSAALSAAESGHLVIATSHAKSTREAIDRVVSAFPDEQRTFVREVLASTLTAVLCQVLVPSVDGTRQWLAYDLVPNVPPITEMIEKSTLRQNVLDQVRAPGIILRNKVLLDHVRAGRISREDALLASDNPKGLTEMLPTE